MGRSKPAADPCDTCSYPPPADCWTPDCPVYSDPGYNAYRAERREFLEDEAALQRADPHRSQQ